MIYRLRAVFHYFFSKTEDFINLANPNSINNYVFNIWNFDMARPKPSILIENVDQRTHKADQVLMADAVYAVYYKGTPINLRTINKVFNYPPAKYRKCSFGNPGHAFNLAERLNETFKCNDFTVHKLVAGPALEEGKK